VHASPNLLAACAGTAADGDLPSVMTCANYIKLPPYSSLQARISRPRTTCVGAYVYPIGNSSSNLSPTITLHDLSPMLVSLSGTPPAACIPTIGLVHVLVST